MKIPVELLWDYDNLEMSLRRGFADNYNFYAIFLNTESEIWGNYNVRRENKLFYIGSTRMQTTSQRLLNNHDALLDALREYPGDIYIALGKWNISGIGYEIGINDANEIVNAIESAFISNLKPIKNIQSKNKYLSTQLSLSISSQIRSYGGINLEKLILNGNLVPIDSLLFSSLGSKYSRYFTENRANEGLIKLMAQVELDIGLLNREFIV